jgi:DNA-binding response OmpR family regulator
VEVFIARLRRKLGPSSIETVRGLGYRIKATP